MPVRLQILDDQSQLISPAKLTTTPPPPCREEIDETAQRVQ